MVLRSAQTLTFIFILSVSALTAQTPVLPTGVERVATVEAITEYRLANGLRAVLVPDPSKSTTTVNITYLAGSRHENYGETGMAHIVEHLVSFGSPKHPDAKKEQQERGARRNASTAVDRTNYYETFPASDANLEWALDLEADRMINAPVRKDILDTQMTVVRNEMESGENNPLNALAQRVMATAYLWHNYGKSTIGARSDVENVPIERLQAFYKRYYQPDNAVLIVAGKFDEAAAVRLIAQKFGPIPKATRALDRTYTVDPPQDGERSVTVQRVGDIQALYLAYRVPAVAHPDSAAVDLLSYVLASSPAGRLHKALVETGKAVQTGGGQRVMLEEGVANFVAVVRKDASVEDARTTMLATLDAVSTVAPTTEEVERARADLLRQFELALNDSEQLGMSLSEYSAAGDWRLLFIRRDRIRKTTVDDVVRVAQTYFKPVNRTVGLFVPVAVPARAEIPRTPDITALVKDYKGDATASAGEVFDPSPANIESRTVRSQLPAGIKLALLPKKTRGATVNVQFRLNYGDENSLKNLSASAELTPAMLSRGTTKRTRQQIQDEMNRIKANIGVAGTGSFTQVSIQTVRENLPDAIRLTAELLRQPSFPEAEFEQLRQERIAGAEVTRSDPQAIAQLNLLRHLSPYPKGDLRYVPPVDERIEALKAVTLDDLKRFHREFFGASNAELAVTGDFDAEVVRRLVGELFGDWKGTKAFADTFRPYRELSPSNQTFDTPDKANAMVGTGMRFRLGDQDADYPAIVLANYMLGGHTASRLYSRIRAKDGLSYSVGSSLATLPGDNAADFMVFAITAPENASKVETAIREELQRALKGGFPADEVAGAKKGWIQTQEVSRSQDPELVGRLRSQLHSNRTMAFDIDLETKIKALTPDQILTALRGHLDVSQLSFVKAGDFKKTAGK
jgi:zinc protease